MRPIYRTERAVVYHGDCRETVTGWSRGIMDLIVTDPPYGINYRSGNRKHGDHRRLVGDDASFDLSSYLDVLLRTLACNRHIYLFGRWTWTDDVALTEPAELIWDKAGLSLGDLSNAWSKSHEYITFSTFERSKRNRKHGYGGLSARLRRGSVIKSLRPNSRGSKLHPTRKPIGVLQPLIESSSLVGEVVFDPFAGSGSTGEAALLCGRRCVLIEIDREYCDIIIDRISKLEKWLDQCPIK